MLLLIELNEINFDLVDDYVAAGAPLPHLRQLGLQNCLSSYSEDVYEHLEPWIQWPSVHTGKTYNEHQVFRLGDMVNYKGTQLFEDIERRGYSVGNLSAMNAANRLSSPAFFIPDPWTDTPSDNSFVSRSLTQAVSQTVNDNSGGKITAQSAFNLAMASIALISPSRYFWFIKKLLWTLRKPWRKAMFLDLLLAEYFVGLVKGKKPEFSTLFLNAGAHIQHHYLLSSSVLTDTAFRNPEWYVEAGADPLLEVYQQYDEILGRIMSLPNARYIIATGLSQKSYDKPVFYYRLADHASFLNLLGISFVSIEPRMTRDLLVRFSNDEARDQAVEKLSALTIDGVALFGQLDKRPNEVFVTMDYPTEILSDTVLDTNEFLGTSFKLAEHVNFVAIKNGEHQGKGFVFIDPRLEGAEFKDGHHVARLYDTIMSQFPDRNSVKAAE
ncbi:hypothetical protein N9M29_01360 [Alphaproteobacteria bacterium]|nr:hypothetical protein [Alphaproteobacteria bacterium]MDA9581457.1 hypothetical protein [bacterium]MDA8624007.1 hypothetical protein [Alphaproteobacteria bacterium]MDA8625797.1 hypothetical protein [Alphaproteobacteria bacterium]MDA8642664.1 hypothetical protein [Alphaproteobacteria bacterium]